MRVVRFYIYISSCAWHFSHMAVLLQSSPFAIQYCFSRTNFFFLIQFCLHLFYNNQYSIWIFNSWKWTFTNTFGDCQKNHTHTHTVGVPHPHSLWIEPENNINAIKQCDSIVRLQFANETAIYTSNILSSVLANVATKTLQSKMKNT